MAKFLGFEIGGSKTQSPEASHYSVMSGNIFPCGDMSKPYINDNQRGAGGYVPFGADNLYPELLTSLYYTSPLHRAICDFKVSTICGKGFDTDFTGTTAAEKIKEAGLIAIIKKAYKQITLDIVIHERCYMLLNFTEDGKLKAAKRLDPTMLRHITADDFGNITKVFFKRDWAQGSVTTAYDVYKRGEIKTTCVYMYQTECPGILTYSIPGYATASHSMFLDGEIPYLQKSNIINSINPSFILNFPKVPANKAEMDKIKNSLETKGKGAANTGRVISLFSLNRDQMPDITTVNTNNNDKLFLQTYKELRDSICFSHSINPSLIGIKVAGSLGNSEELNISWGIFVENVVRPLQETVEDYWNTLLDMNNITGTVKMNGTVLNITTK